MKAAAHSPADYGGTVRSSDKVADFAPSIVRSGKPFGVTDEAGAVIGEVTFADVVDLLAGISIGTPAGQST